MKNTLYIFILLLPFFTSAQNKKTHLRDGNNLYEDSLFNDAEMKYRKSLEKDQDYFTASYNLADAIYKQERFEESSSLFDGLIDNAKTKDEKAKLYHNLGNSLFKQQKLKESIQSYKNALKNNPKDEETRHNLALAQKMLQQEENQQEEQEKKDEENKEEQEENKEEENKEEQEANRFGNDYIFSDTHDENGKIKFKKEHLHKNFKRKRRYEQGRCRENVRSFATTRERITRKDAKEKSQREKSKSVKRLVN